MTPFDPSDREQHDYLRETLRRIGLGSVHDYILSLEARLAANERMIDCANDHIAEFEARLAEASKDTVLLNRLEARYGGGTRWNGPSLGEDFLALMTCQRGNMILHTSVREAIESNLEDDGSRFDAAMAREET